MNGSKGRIVILLAMLLLGADYACASLHHAEEAEYAAVASVSAQPVRMSKADAPRPSSHRPIQNRQYVCANSAPATIDILSRCCILLI